MYCISAQRLLIFAALVFANKSSAVAEMGDRLATIGGKVGGLLCPFRGEELGPHLTQCGRRAGAKAYLHAKFHLDSSNRLATIRQRHRQDRQTTVR